MKTRKQLLKIEINRCKKNLKTITDLHRIAIIKEHIAYLENGQRPI